jgi:hypothetical protein
MGGMRLGKSNVIQPTGFQLTGSDNSSFWFEATVVGQWDGEMGKASEIALEDWRRFKAQASKILEPLITNQHLRQDVVRELADAAFPKALKPILGN